MRKLLIILLVGFIILITNPTDAKTKKLFYTLPKGVQVLAFIGDPNKSAAHLETIRLKSYENQRVILFHKKSGRGIWAFHLRGFIHNDPVRGRVEINSQGYFIVSKRKLKK